MAKHHRGINKASAKAINNQRKKWRQSISAENIGINKAYRIRKWRNGGGESLNGGIKHMASAAAISRRRNQRRMASAWPSAASYGRHQYPAASGENIETIKGNSVSSCSVKHRRASKNAGVISCGGGGINNGVSNSGAAASQRVTRVNISRKHAYGASKQRRDAQRIGAAASRCIARGGRAGIVAAKQQISISGSIKRHLAWREINGISASGGRQSAAYRHDVASKAAWRRHGAINQRAPRKHGVAAPSANETDNIRRERGIKWRKQ